LTGAPSTLIGALPLRPRPHLGNAGIPTYGVSGVFGELDDSRAHCRDERVGVQQFYDGGQFLYTPVRTLAGAPARQADGR